jgi:hypothetical protein
MKQSDPSAKLASLIAEKDALLRRKVAIETRQWNLRGNAGPAAKKELAEIETQLANAQANQLDLERQIEQSQAAAEEAAAAERRAQLEAVREREQHASKSVIECAKKLQAALLEAREIQNELRQWNEGSRYPIPAALSSALSSAVAQWGFNPPSLD